VPFVGMPDKNNYSHGHRRNCRSCARVEPGVHVVKFARRRPEHLRLLSIRFAAVLALLMCGCLPGVATASQPGIVLISPDVHDGQGPGSLLANQAPIKFDLSFLELYKWQITGVAAFCLVQFLFLLGLLVQRASRAHTEIRLRESEARFRLMADTAPVMIWMSGPDKRCTYFNKHWLDFTGRPLEQELGDGWSQGVHSDDLQCCLDTYCTAFDARQRFRMEYRLKRCDGSHRWLLDTGVPRFDTDGTFEGYIGSCIEISDEKQVRDKLLDNQHELQTLTRKLLLAQETERRHIARELHDDLNQNLALLSVEMDLLANRPINTELVRRRLHDLSARVKELSSSVHGISHRLHPSNLEQLGLGAAVRGLCSGLTQLHGLPIEFTERNLPPSIGADVALCLYRITQEALSNVIKHSGAQHAEVELTARAEELDLRIGDDGVGFDPELVNAQGGLGLVSMRERLGLVAGKITFDSAPSAGTRIKVRVPLPTASEIGTALKEESATEDESALVYTL
jgi:PAS domain S-box-containing protein